MASDIETFCCDENINPTIKLETLSITDEDEISDAIDDPTIADDMKIGEIFYVRKDHLKFVCVHCAVEFPLLVQFTAHIERHLQQIYANTLSQPKLPVNQFEHVDMMPMLVDCNVSFSDADDMTADHYNDDNDNDNVNGLEPDQPPERQFKTKKHKCTDCNEHFSQPYYLKKHLAIVHRGRFYCCTVCHIEVTHKQNMYRHMRNKHPTEDVNAFTEMYKEPNDGNDDQNDDQNDDESQSGADQPHTDTIEVNERRKKITKRPKIKVSLSVGVLPCPECEQRFERRSFLLKHYEIVHKGRLFACSVCHMKLTHKQNMFRHMRNQHPLVDVNAFLAVYDNDERTNPNVRIDQRLVKRKSMKRRNETNGVKRVNVKRNAAGGFDCSSDCDEEKIYCCTICNTKLMFKRNMIRHVRNKHPANDVYSFIELNSNRSVCADDNQEIIDVETEILS